MRKSFFFLFLMTAVLSAGENDYLRQIGRPPEAKAQRRQGGESLPPLPLPATPLRRSEKKRPPSASALIGKVVWGSYLDVTSPNGMVERVFDWNMVPADCQQLLRRVKEVLKLEYKVQTIDLATFSGDPAELPILYFSGGRTLRFTQEERVKLRKYLLSGGTIWFDSVVGSPYFHKSALFETRMILPESPIRVIDPDHAMFRMVRKTDEARINKNERVKPRLEGVYIGARLAVVISPFGLGAGWDRVEPTAVKDSRYYTPSSALDIGVNLAAYVIGWYENGQVYAAGEVHGNSPDLPGRIVFAQVKTDGLWNPDPGAETKFMRYLSKNLRIDAGTEPKRIDPVSSPLEDLTFLYLSGIGTFELSETAVARLRAWLNAGGFLLVNNALGMNEFDASARRLAAKLFPGKKLQELPSGHPVFTKGPFRFNRSGFSEAASRKYPGRRVPLLYAVFAGDRPALIYSPVDLGGGWLQTARPGAVTYDSETALRLGACLITYFSTH